MLSLLVFIFLGRTNEKPWICTLGVSMTVQNGGNIEIISSAFLAVHALHHRNTAEPFMIFCLLCIFLVSCNELSEDA